MACEGELGRKHRSGVCPAINVVFFFVFLLLTHRSEEICVQRMINVKAKRFLHFDRILLYSFQKYTRGYA